MLMSIVKPTASQRTRSACPISVLLGILIILGVGCVSRGTHVRKPKRAPDAVVNAKVTGYSDDKISTGWRRNCLGVPVYAYGPNKGKRKRVGITSTGTQAQRGTLATDHRYLPVGTIIHVPGYGVGIVEDTGGALKGYHVDLFFTTRKQALIWGVQKKRIEVWFPN